MIGRPSCPVKLRHLLELEMVVRGFVNLGWPLLIIS